MDSTDIKTAYQDYYLHVDGPIGGSERQEWAARTFFQQTRGKKILEIGCGEGTLLQLVREGNEVQGVDISQTGVERCRQKGIPCIHADASNEPLPFPNDTFDVAITLETIEHVENPHRMIWEIKRLLKPGGILLISVPGEKGCHPFIYPGLFTRKHFTQFLRLNGLDILDIHGWGQAPLLSHWTERVRQSPDQKLANTLADVVHFVGRKRNLVMRKRLGTPLACAFTVNFLCRNADKSRNRAAQVARETTPR